MWPGSRVLANFRPDFLFEKLFIGFLAEVFVFPRVDIIITSMSYGSVGIAQKIDFETRPDLGCTPQNVEGKAFGQSICVSVLLSLFQRILTGLRVDRSS